MRFTVVWNRIAEEKLAALWTVARNQQAVTTSANHIDRLLRDSGEEVGVFFFEGQYLLAEPPLAVLFTRSHDDRMICVFDVLISKEESL